VAQLAVAALVPPQIGAPSEDEPETALTGGLPYLLNHAREVRGRLFVDRQRPRLTRLLDLRQVAPGRVMRRELASGVSERHQNGSSRKRDKGEC
jgi:hypothetical protein